MNLLKIKKLKKLYLLKFSIILLFIFIFAFSDNIFAGLFDSDPALISKLSEAFATIKNGYSHFLHQLPAVAVGSGIFMKKFSFGDEERIRTAKKIIRGTLFSYGFILAIDLILSAIQSLIV